MNTEELNKKLKFATAKCIAATKEGGVEYSNKKYLPVKTRMEIMREVFGLELGVTTVVNMVASWGQPAALASAAITVGDLVIASGHGMVMDTGATAPVEKAETIAIGRALACLGLIGEEYASANEMERVAPVKVTTDGNEGSDGRARSVQAEKAAQVDDLREKYEGNMGPKEREFREAVEHHFPPGVNRYSYKMPANNAPEEVDLVYREIDRIEDVEELRAYYDALRNDDFSSWVDPQDWSEIKASFKARDSQLNGGK